MYDLILFVDAKILHCKNTNVLNVLNTFSGEVRGGWSPVKIEGAIIYNKKK